MPSVRESEVLCVCIVGQCLLQAFARRKTTSCTVFGDWKNLQIFSLKRVIFPLDEILLLPLKLVLLKLFKLEVFHELFFSLRL